MTDPGSRHGTDEAPDYEGTAGDLDGISARLRDLHRDLQERRPVADVEPPPEDEPNEDA